MDWSQTSFLTIPQEMGHLEMLKPIKSPVKEVDVDFMVFVERYATDLLKWDILTFFSHNPEFFGTTEQIAQRIGRSSHSIRPELGDLALLGILDQKQRAEDRKALYKLSQEPSLRQLTLKFASNQ
jgi:hypothetical protein